MVRPALFMLMLLCASISFAQNVKVPAPYGVLPSPAQLQWQQMEYYMFIHFGPNTFTDKEWG